MPKTVNLAVGSTNPVKAVASREAFILFGYNVNRIFPLNVSSGVNPQPTSLEEIVQGAKQRAKNSYLTQNFEALPKRKCHFGIGLEDGIFEVPYLGYMNLGCASIYDGINFYSGLSPAFTYPEKVIAKVLEEKKDINQAFYELKLTDSRKVGSRGGAIHILSRGIVLREDLLKLAVVMALTDLNVSRLNRK